MKKIFVVLSAALFLLPQVVIPQGSLSDYSPWSRSHTVTVTDITAAAADSLKVEGRVVARGRVTQPGLTVSVRIKTRGTNDSLVLWIQRSGDPTDSTNWITVGKTAPGVSTATGTGYSLSMPLGSEDSTAALLPYVRIYEDHSVAAWTAADTSSYLLFIYQWGQ